MNMGSVRLLVANHIDQSLLHQPDQRAFVQRIFWLAQEGDIVVVPAPPDQCFLDHVFSLLNIRKDRVTIFVAPEGRYSGRLLDPLSLTSNELTSQLQPLIENCSELICLWPSTQVAQLAMRLQISNSMQGASYFSQGGDALANSKATFRAYAAAVGIPVPNGFVCRTKEDLEMAVLDLLKNVNGVMVKQSHNSAAAGCTVIRKNSKIHARTAGSIWSDDISELSDGLPYLWKWSSVDNRFPVIVEELVEGCKTIWFEFKANDSGVTFLASGGLEYEEGKLVREHTPLTWSIPKSALKYGLGYARKLAEHYHMSGYRGHLSADCIIEPSGRILFTEMNARIGGSLPIYDGVWRRVIKKFDKVDRHIVQYVTPSHWINISTEEILTRLSIIKCLYCNETRTGAILGIPPIPEVENGNYLITLATRAESDQNEMFSRIDAEFS